VFRVTRERHVDGVVLKLEGRLAAAWVEELAGVIGAAAGEGARVTLDLHDLSFADAQGVAVIRVAVEGGARLVGGSRFIECLIDSERLP
jgi:hypothetical protein